MRSQQFKNFYYASVGKLSILSLYWHKKFRPHAFDNSYINIGCGPKYIDGMINVDGNILCRKDIWLDVTLGLPFPSNSLKGIYSSHVLEHFDGRKVKKLLSEFHRVLKQGGAVRLVVPSLEYAISAYQGQDFTKLPEWPDKYDSLGGRFNNFLLCRNQHFMMFDFGLMEELLRETGFSEIFRRAAHSSLYFGKTHMSFESDSAPVSSSLYVEAIKQ